MILTINYEEMLALRAGKRAVTGGAADSSTSEGARSYRDPYSTQAASALPPLDGDVSVETLAEVEVLEAGFLVLAEALRAEMDQAILATHPASEDAVASYFDYGHVMAVLGRVQEMRAQMEDVIELVSGGSEGDELLSTFVFPD